MTTSLQRGDVVLFVTGEVLNVWAVCGKSGMAWLRDNGPTRLVCAPSAICRAIPGRYFAWTGWSVS